jgi:hypothetical protein
MGEYHVKNESGKMLIQSWGSKKTDLYFYHVFMSGHSSRLIDTFYKCGYYTSFLSNNVDKKLIFLIVFDTSIVSSNVFKKVMIYIYIHLKKHCQQKGY